MFRKLAALILLLSILAVTFSNSLFLLDYKINRAAYTNSCINKYRPYLKCNGKCQLMKKMKAREEKENKNAEPVYVSSIVLFAPETTRQATIAVTTSVIIYPVISAETVISGYPFNVFQPPRC